MLKNILSRTSTSLKHPASSLRRGNRVRIRYSRKVLTASRHLCNWTFSTRSIFSPFFFPNTCCCYYRHEEVNRETMAASFSFACITRWKGVRYMGIKANTYILVSSRRYSRIVIAIARLLKYEGNVFLISSSAESNRVLCK